MVVPPLSSFYIVSFLYLVLINTSGRDVLSRGLIYMQNCRVIGREGGERSGGRSEEGWRERRRVNVKEFTRCQTRVEGVLPGLGCVRVVC